MRIVRREVSRARIYLQFIILFMLGVHLLPNNADMLMISAIGMISHGLTLTRLDMGGGPARNMRCLEWGPDFTVNGSRVTFHRSGTYRIEQKFEHKSEDSSRKGI